MSTKNNPSKLHPELFKMYNSPIYRKKIKKMVERAKNYIYSRDGVIVDKLPRRASLPKKSTPYTDKELEAFKKANQYRLDKETVHYFAQSIEAGMDRRLISGNRDEVTE